jgi:sporulation protein YlmC with PRC-barrel domain
MRSTMTTTPLVSVKSGQLSLMDTSEDILGRKVVDRTGQEIGKVDDLFADPTERRVRFFSLKSGDFLGLGGKTFLVPVDVIQSVNTDQVILNDTKDRILNGPQVTDQVRTTDATGSVDANSIPIVEVYDFYAIDEPYWSPTYRRPNWA